LDDEGDMKRLPVFVVVGPFLCSFIFIAMASMLSGPGPLDEGGQMFFATLLGGYGITLPFMLAIAYIDHRLAGNRWRVVICALVGFGLGVAFVYLIALESGLEEQFEKFRRTWFIVGLVIGIPAALCSWLGGKYYPDR